MILGVEVESRELLLICFAGDIRCWITRSRRFGIVEQFYAASRNVSPCTTCSGRVAVGHTVTAHSIEIGGCANPAADRGLEAGIGTWRGRSEEEFANLSKGSRTICAHGSRYEQQGNGDRTKHFEALRKDAVGQTLRGQEFGTVEWYVTLVSSKKRLGTDELLQLAKKDEWLRAFLCDLPDWSLLKSPHVCTRYFSYHTTWNWLSISLVLKRGPAQPRFLVVA